MVGNHLELLSVSPWVQICTGFKVSVFSGLIKTNLCPNELHRCLIQDLHWALLYRRFLVAVYLFW